MKGSVLPELAYHKIITICRSDNLTSDYGFTFQAKSIKQYKYFFINYDPLSY